MNNTDDIRPRCAVPSGSADLAYELSRSNGMLRYVLMNQVKRLRELAAMMDEEGKNLKILGTTETRIPHSFSRGAEMCGAADMAREWAANLEALLPNFGSQPCRKPSTETSET